MRSFRMKEVDVNGKNILLARDQGNYYAVSAKCTHYGASLAKGLIYLLLYLSRNRTIVFIVVMNQAQADLRFWRASMIELELIIVQTT